MPKPENHSEIPKQYDPAAAQAKWYPHWEQAGYFHSEPNPEKEPYSIVIPPPNVTGALHLGHALNNTLQDVLIRVKRMQGYETLWMPGTDHAGIATQAMVERRLREDEGKTRLDLGREKLIERIWGWKDAYEKRILGQLKQMGFSCDWERTRFTLDPVCAKAVRHTFYKMFQDGLIYRGERLVNWDTMLQTAVSDDEVVRETVDGSFWYFNYPVMDPQESEPHFVTIATTRPETMLGDTAVAVHPAPAAALEKAVSELEKRLESAPEKEKEELTSQLDALRERQKEMLPYLEMLTAMAKAGRKLLLPLMNREIPLVADEWAKPELGTGCVKITPAHDPNDYEVGKRQNLPMLNVINLDGTINENAGKYQGLTIKKARQAVLADLEEQGLLVKTEDRVIELAHSDRSKTPIEPLIVPQWFIKMDMLAQSAIDAVESEEIKIIPKRYTKSYLDWLSEKRDWPIGRQLWWGHRIPIWYCDGATEAEIEKAFAGRDDVSYRYDEEISKWLISLQEGDTLGDAALAILGKYEIEQEDEVLDTWFSSALWPHSTFGWPEATPELAYYLPTNVLITSRDILTLWVARMALATKYNVDCKPFSEVFIHPKILDKYGETMSKSKGNGVDPLDIIDKFGADSLRFALVYLTTETQDFRMPVEFECPHCKKLIDQTKKIRELSIVECPQCKKTFSTQWATQEEQEAHPRATVTSERFEMSRNFCNKLWNAARFTLMNLEGFTPAPVADDELLTEDRWILSRLATVTREVTRCLDEYKYAEMARLLYDFAWDDFCSAYIEITKSRLDDEATQATAQRMLAHVLDRLLRLLHPITPFVTEEIWSRLGEVAPVRGLNAETVSESIMQACWHASDASQVDATIESQFAVFQEVLRAVRDCRAKQNVSPKEQVEFSLRLSAENQALLEPMADYFAGMANATLTELGSEVKPPEFCATAALTGIDVFVNLEGLIDIAAEIAKNEKELTRLAGQIAGREKKLSNEKFVANAPAEVVAKERQTQEEMRAQVESIKQTIARLEEKK